MVKKSFKCSCGKSMGEVELEFEGFTVRGWRCDSCGEELIDPWAVETIREMRHGSKVKLREVGKSLVVTIPAPVRQAARLHEGEPIEWRAEKGELILGEHLLRKIIPAGG